MRDLQEVAKRLGDARREWMELQHLRQSEGSSTENAMERRIRDARYSEMCALSWVLGIDVQAMNALGQPLPAGVEPVTEVTVTYLHAMDSWLVEFPAESSREHRLWPMQYWTTLLTTRQIRQLAGALLGAYAQFKQGRKVPVMVLPISLPVGDGLTDGDAAGAVEADLVPGA